MHKSVLPVPNLHTHTHTHTYTFIEMSTEVDFANKFVQLLDVTAADAATQDDFINNWKIGNLDTLTDFSFPHLENPYVAHANDASHDAMEVDTDEESVVYEISLKSLKAPKFNKSLNMGVSSSTKIYNIKNELCQLLREEDAIVADVSDIKLMLRAKTLGDSDSVLHILQSNNLDKLALNVLISKFREVEAEPVQATTPLMEDTPTVTEESWNKIAAILYSDLKDQAKANELVAKLKSFV